MEEKKTNYKVWGIIYIFTVVIFLLEIWYFLEVASDEGLIPFLSIPLHLFSIFFFIYGFILLFKKEVPVEEKLIPNSNEIVKVETKNSKTLFSNIIVIPIIILMGLFLSIHASGFGGIGIAILVFLVIIGYFIFTLFFHLFTERRINEEGKLILKGSKGNTLFKKSKTIFYIFLVFIFLIGKYVILDFQLGKEGRIIEEIAEDHLIFLKGLPLYSSVEELNSSLNSPISEIEQKKGLTTSQIIYNGEVYMDPDESLELMLKGCNKKITFFAPHNRYSRLLYLDNKLVFKWITEDKSGPVKYNNISKSFLSLSPQIFKKSNVNNTILICDKPFPIDLFSRGFRMVSYYYPTPYELNVVKSKLFQELNK